MPNGNLTIRHTPATVPGGARPGWGLPFQQLPQARLTPESMLEQEIQTGRQAIQDKYALQWKEVNRSRRFVGAAKTQRMLQQIDMSAKQEVLQFNQQAQQQMAQLRNIDQLAQQGAITNPEQIKARMTFGPDVARSMYPEPEREKPPIQQFADLDIYSHRISDELERFQEISPKKPSKALFALGPVVGMAGAYRRLAAAKKRKVQIWDFTTGDWRKTTATPEEIAEYDMWLQEEKDVAERKKELTGQLSVGRRRVQPGVKGGTFSDKIAESIRPPTRTPAITKPKVIRQRSKLTGQIRESRDGGKTWQIVSG